MAALQASGVAEGKWQQEVSPVHGSMDMRPIFPERAIASSVECGAMRRPGFLQFRVIENSGRRGAPHSTELAKLAQGKTDHF